MYSNDHFGPNLYGLPLFDGARGTCGKAVLNIQNMGVGSKFDDLKRGASDLPGIKSD